MKDTLDREKATLEARLDAVTRTREQLEEESRSTFKLVAAELLNHSRKAMNEEGKTSLGQLLTPLREQIDGLNKELKEYQHKQDVNSQLFGKELEKMVAANKEITQEASISEPVEAMVGMVKMGRAFVIGLPATTRSQQLSVSARARAAIALAESIAEPPPIARTAWILFSRHIFPPTLMSVCLGLGLTRS